MKNFLPIMAAIFAVFLFVQLLMLDRDLARVARDIQSTDSRTCQLEAFVNHALDKTESNEALAANIQGCRGETR